MWCRRSATTAHLPLSIPSVPELRRQRWKIRFQKKLSKNAFDRLLAEVQAISAQVCGRDVHTVQEVLVEELDSHVEGLVTGRMSNNTIVHFPGGKELIGKIVKVYLEESKGFYYMGSLVD